MVCLLSSLGWGMRGTCEWPLFYQCVREEVCPWLKFPLTHRPRWVVNRLLSKAEPVAHGHRLKGNNPDKETSLFQDISNQVQSKKAFCRLKSVLPLQQGSTFYMLPHGPLTRPLPEPHCEGHMFSAAKYKWKSGIKTQENTVWEDLKPNL